MKLLVARHGNTFASGDKIIYAGSNNDLPLVEKGFEQAVALSRYLKDENLIPTAVYAAPLLRTKDYAKTVISKLNLNLKVNITDKLIELDYGDWGGKTKEEIIDMGFEEELSAWDKSGVFPDNANWIAKEEDIKQSILAFSDFIKSRYSDRDTILLVSSNGVIRYFLNLITGLYKEYKDKELLKVKTGSISIFSLEGNNWNLDNWNIIP